MEWSLLVIRSTDTQPRWFPFEPGRFWVAGRYATPAQAVDRAVLEGSTNEFDLNEQYYMPLDPDPIINRWHCEFRHENDGAYLRDYSSRSGTFLNGLRTTEKCSLRLDDEIQIGNCKIFVSGTTTIDPSWLAWENGALVELAVSIRDTRDFTRLPILGDRLREAGCTDADILDHCLDRHRDPQRCCILDLLLETQNH